MKNRSTDKNEQERLTRLLLLNASTDPADYPGQDFFSSEVKFDSRRLPDGKRIDEFFLNSLVKKQTAIAAQEEKIVLDH